MGLNKVAAAYLAYFAYIDDALETVKASDLVTYLAKVPAGAANGPWKLCWGPAVNDGVLGYVAQRSMQRNEAIFHLRPALHSRSSNLVLSSGVILKEIVWLYVQ